MELSAIILAGGKGARMKSLRPDFSKAAMPILGKPMISYVIDSLKDLEPKRLVAVIGPKDLAIEEIIKGESDIIHEPDQKGTGWALKSAQDIIKEKNGIVLVCRSDTPLITAKTLKALVSSHLTNHNDVTVLSANYDDPYGCSRIKKEQGHVLKIVSQRDCSLEEDTIHEVNAGIYVFNNSVLEEGFEKFFKEESAQELSISDLINRLIEENMKVGVFLSADKMETMDVNDRYVLSKAEKAMRERINKRLMLSGVTIVDPDTTYIGVDVVIQNDTVIYPNTTIFGKSKIGRDNVIGPNTYLNNVKIDNQNRITFSHIDDCEIGSSNDLGPYLRMRNGCVIEDNTLIGNFNELKNAHIGKISRASHLSYLGDVTIGEDVNIGCGTIIANFDGVNKFSSVIKDKAFVGSGSTIISPVTVGEDAFIAAGSVINHDVGDGDMGIARARQENKEKYSAVLKSKALNKK